MVLGTAAATTELTDEHGSAIDTERHVKDWRGSEFEMGVLAANSFDRKILIDAVPGMSPWIHLGDFLSRSC